MIIVIFLLSLLLIMALSIMVYDTGRFVTVETSLQSEKIKKDMTVAVLSDLHNKCYGKNNEKLLKKIEEAGPDLILIAGDMLNAKPEADFSMTASFLKRLAKRYRVLYGIGNHEHRLMLYPEIYGSMHEAYWNAIKDDHIVPLVNERTERGENGICIFGARIDKRFYKRFHTQKMEPDYLQKLLGKPEKGMYNILLAHNPDYFKSYAEWGADLVLSGHVHGGIVRLPFLGGVLSPACRLFPKYDGGVFKEGKSTMILSRGLGEHTIPIRLFNPGELHIIHLIHKNT